ncbi:unknown [Brachyspira sp. CAG:700]|nr:unknown [Brachyspira sp. CAG:700]
MINKIIFNENITVAFCSSAQLSSAQLSSNINLFKIFALLFNALNSGLSRFLIKARNDDYAFSYASKFEIISHNKNLKSIYYGFLFNKQNFIVRGGIEQ